MRNSWSTAFGRENPEIQHEAQNIGYICALGRAVFCSTLIGASSVLSFDWTLV